MKVIIDIPKEEYGIIKNYKSFMPWAEGLIKKGVAIPEGATNGDVIMAMFPNAEIHQSGGYTGCLFYPSVMLEDTKSDWWKAPYKKESEDK